MSVDGQRKSFWESLGETQTIVSLAMLYCAIHFLTRYLLSPNLNGADAQQVLFGQSFQWGYMPGRPPLMTWLAWAVLSVSHGSRLALFLLREVIFGIGLIAFFAAARTVLADIRRAALATFFLCAAFGVGWLLHWGNMDHVLLATMCCLYIWADTRALGDGRFADYLVLGAVTGLGVLSSYVFLVLPLAMSIALALTPALRARLRLVPLIAAAAVALLVVAPYFAFAPDAAAYAVAGARPAVLDGVRDLALALVVFALPAGLLFLILYPRVARPLAPRDRARDWMRFFRLSMAAAAIVAVAAVLFFRGGNPAAFTYPVLLPLPLYFFSRTQLVYGDGAERSDKYFLLAILACVVTGIGLRIWMYESRAHDCVHCAEYWPMPRFADTFRQAGFYGGTIAAPDAALAGNLRQVFPDSRVVTPDAPASHFGLPVRGECLVVWDGEGNIPTRLGDYVTQTYGAKLEERAVQGDTEATLLTSKTRRAHMNFLILADGVCDKPRP